MTLSMVMEHLSMVVFAIVIAILIGVPLGLLCYLSRAARGVVLRVVDLIQTTPALALLGIIMVTPLGAGKPTVILGLALYSLLPIVRNVTLGLSQVSPAVKEAAKGMGMTRVYSLFHVELPLAMPMLFTGQFTNEVMSELTYRVDVLGEDVDLVAADYLHTLGLL